MNDFYKRSLKDLLFEEETKQKKLNIVYSRRKEQDQNEQTLLSLVLSFDIFDAIINKNNKTLLQKAFDQELGEESKVRSAKLGVGRVISTSLISGTRGLNIENPNIYMSKLSLGDDQKDQASKIRTFIEDVSKAYGFLKNQEYVGLKLENKSKGKILKIKKAKYYAFAERVLNGETLNFYNKSDNKLNLDKMINHLKRLSDQLITSSQGQEEVESEVESDDQNVQQSSSTAQDPSKEEKVDDDDTGDDLEAAKRAIQVLHDHIKKTQKFYNIFKNDPAKQGIAYEMSTFARMAAVIASSMSITNLFLDNEENNIINSLRTEKELRDIGQKLMMFTHDDKIRQQFKEDTFEFVAASNLQNVNSSISMFFTKNFENKTLLEYLDFDTEENKFKVKKDSVVRVFKELINKHKDKKLNKKLVEDMLNEAEASFNGELGGRGAELMNKIVDSRGSQVKSEDEDDGIPKINQVEFYIPESFNPDAKYNSTCISIDNLSEEDKNYYATTWGYNSTSKIWTFLFRDIGKKNYNEAKRSALSSYKFDLNELNTASNIVKNILKDAANDSSQKEGQKIARKIADELSIDISKPEEAEVDEDSEESQPEASQEDTQTFKILQFKPQEQTNPPSISLEALDKGKCKLANIFLNISSNHTGIAKDLYDISKTIQAILDQRKDFKSNYIKNDKTESFNIGLSESDINLKLKCVDLGKGKSVNGIKASIFSNFYTVAVSAGGQLEDIVLESKGIKKLKDLLGKIKLASTEDEIKDAIRQQEITDDIFGGIDATFNPERVDLDDKGQPVKLGNAINFNVEDENVQSGLEDAVNQTKWEYDFPPTSEDQIKDFSSDVAENLPSALGQDIDEEDLDAVEDLITTSLKDAFSDTLEPASDQTDSSELGKRQVYFFTNMSDQSRLDEVESIVLVDNISSSDTSRPDYKFRTTFLNKDNNQWNFGQRLKFSAKEYYDLKAEITQKTRSGTLSPAAPTITSISGNPIEDKDFIKKVLTSLYETGKNNYLCQEIANHLNVSLEKDKKEDKDQTDTGDSGGISFSEAFENAPKIDESNIEDNLSSTPPLIIKTKIKDANKEGPSYYSYKFIAINNSNKFIAINKDNNLDVHIKSDAESLAKELENKSLVFDDLDVDFNMTPDDRVQKFKNILLGNEESEDQAQDEDQGQDDKFEELKKAVENLSVFDVNGDFKSTPHIQLEVDNKVKYYIYKISDDQTVRINQKYIGQHKKSTLEEFIDALKNNKLNIEEMNISKNSNFGKRKKDSLYNILKDYKEADKEQESEVLQDQQPEKKQEISNYIEEPLVIVNRFNELSSSDDYAKHMLFPMGPTGIALKKLNDKDDVKFITDQIKVEYDKKLEAGELEGQLKNINEYIKQWVFSNVIPGLSKNKKLEKYYSSVIKKNSKLKSAIKKEKEPRRRAKIFLSYLLNNEKVSVMKESFIYEKSLTSLLFEDNDRDVLEEAIFGGYSDEFYNELNQLICYYILTGEKPASVKIDSDKVDSDVEAGSDEEEEVEASDSEFDLSIIEKNNEKLFKFLKSQGVTKRKYLYLASNVSTLKDFVDVAKKENVLKALKSTLLKFYSDLIISLDKTDTSKAYVNLARYAKKDESYLKGYLIYHYFYSEFENKSKDKVLNDIVQGINTLNESLEEKVLTRLLAESDSESNHARPIGVINDSISSITLNDFVSFVKDVYDNKPIIPIHLETRKSQATDASSLVSNIEKAIEAAYENLSSYDQVKKGKEKDLDIYDIEKIFDDEYEKASEEDISFDNLKKSIKAVSEIKNFSPLIVSPLERTIELIENVYAIALMRQERFSEITLSPERKKELTELLALDKQQPGTIKKIQSGLEGLRPSFDTRSISRQTVNDEIAKIKEEIQKAKDLEQKSIENLKTLIAKRKEKFGDKLKEDLTNIEKSIVEMNNFNEEIKYDIDNLFKDYENIDLDISYEDLENIFSSLVTQLEVVKLDIEAGNEKAAEDRKANIKLGLLIEKTKLEVTKKLRGDQGERVTRNMLVVLVRNFMSARKPEEIQNMTDRELESVFKQSFMQSFGGTSKSTFGESVSKNKNLLTEGVGVASGLLAALGIALGTPIGYVAGIAAAGYFVGEGSGLNDRIRRAFAKKVKNLSENDIVNELLQSQEIKDFYNQLLVNTSGTMIEKYIFKLEPKLNELGITVNTTGLNNKQVRNARSAVKAESEYSEKIENLSDFGKTFVSEIDNVAYSLIPQMPGGKKFNEVTIGNINNAIKKSKEFNKIIDVLGRMEESKYVYQNGITSLLLEDSEIVDDKKKSKKKKKTTGINVNKLFMELQTAIAQQAEGTNYNEDILKQFKSGLEQLGEEQASVFRKTLKNEKASPLVSSKSAFNLLSSLSGIPAQKLKKSLLENASVNKNLINYNNKSYVESILNESILSGSLSSLLFEKKASSTEHNPLGLDNEEQAKDAFVGDKAIKINDCPYGISFENESGSTITVRLRGLVDDDSYDSDLSSYKSNQIISYDENFNPVTSVKNIAVKPGDNPTDYIANNGFNITLPKEKAIKLINQIEKVDSGDVAGFTPTNDLNQFFQSAIEQHQKSIAVAKTIKAKFGDYCEDFQVTSRGVSFKITTYDETQEEVTKTVFYSNKEINEKFKFETKDFKADTGNVKVQTVTNSDDYFPENLEPTSASDFDLDAKPNIDVPQKAVHGTYKDLAPSKTADVQTQKPFSDKDIKTLTDFDKSVDSLPRHFEEMLEGQDIDSTNVSYNPIDGNIENGLQISVDDKDVFILSKKQLVEYLNACGKNEYTLAKSILENGSLKDKAAETFELSDPSKIVMKGDMASGITFKSPNGETISLTSSQIKEGGGDAFDMSESELSTASSVGASNIKRSIDTPSKAEVTSSSKAEVTPSSKASASSGRTTSGKEVPQASQSQSSAPSSSSSSTQTTSSPAQDSDPLDFDKPFEPIAEDQFINIDGQDIVAVGTKDGYKVYLDVNDTVIETQGDKVIYTPKPDANVLNAKGEIIDYTSGDINDIDLFVYSEDVTGGAAEKVSVSAEKASVAVEKAAESESFIMKAFDYALPKICAVIPLALYGYKAFKKYKQYKDGIEWQNLYSAVEKETTNGGFFTTSFATPIAYRIANIVQESANQLAKQGVMVSGKLNKEGGGLIDSGASGNVNALFSKYAHSQAKQSAKDAAFFGGKPSDKDIEKALNANFEDYLEDIVISFARKYDADKTAFIKQQIKQQIITQRSRSDARRSGTSRLGMGLGALTTGTAAAFLTGATGGAAAIPWIATALAGTAGGVSGRILANKNSENMGVGDINAMIRASIKKDPQIKKDIKRLKGIVIAIAEDIKGMLESKVLHKNKLSSLLFERSLLIESDAKIDRKTLDRRLKNLMHHHYANPGSKRYKTAQGELIDIVAGILEDYFGIKVDNTKPVSPSAGAAKYAAGNFTDETAKRGQPANPALNQMMPHMQMPMNMGQPFMMMPFMMMGNHAGGDFMKEISKMFAEQQKMFMDILKKHAEGDTGASYKDVAKELQENIPELKGIDKALDEALGAIRSGFPTISIENAKSIFQNLEKIVEDFNEQNKDGLKLELKDSFKGSGKEKAFSDTIKGIANLTKQEVNLNESEYNMIISKIVDVFFEIDSKEFEPSSETQTLTAGKYIFGSLSNMLFEEEEIQSQEYSHEMYVSDGQTSMNHACNLMLDINNHENNSFNEYVKAGNSFNDFIAIVNDDENNNIDSPLVGVIRKSFNHYYIAVDKITKSDKEEKDSLTKTLKTIIAYSATRLNETYGTVQKHFKNPRILLLNKNVHLSNIKDYLIDERNYTEASAEYIPNIDDQLTKVETDKTKIAISNIENFVWNFFSKIFNMKEKKSEPSLKTSGYIRKSNKTSKSLNESPYYRRNLSSILFESPKKKRVVNKKKKRVKNSKDIDLRSEWLKLWSEDK